MERDGLYHDVPCSSISVESSIRVGTAGAIWGLCSGPYDATKLGLSGVARATFMVKAVGRIGLQCGSVTVVVVFGSTLTSALAASLIVSLSLQLLRFHAGASYIMQTASSIHQRLLAGFFSMTRCSVQRYRRRDDWVNSCIAGAVAGAAIAARTRSWKNIAEVAGLVSAFSVAADYTKVV